MPLAQARRSLPPLRTYPRWTRGVAVRRLPCRAGGPRRRVAHLVAAVSAAMLFPVDPATLSESQRDGWACAICARDLLVLDDPGVSVGPGVLACTSCVTAYLRGLTDARHQPRPRRTLRRAVVTVLTTAATRRGHRRA